MRDRLAGLSGLTGLPVADVAFDWLMSEACEQAGVDPEKLTARHINSIQRSVDLLFIELETQGATAEYRQDTVELTAPAGCAVVLLPADTIDVSQVAVRDASGVGGDVTLARTHRDKWLSASDRKSSGSPSAYWVSKSLPQGDVVTRLQSPSSAATAFGGGAWGVGAWGGQGLSGAAAQPAISPHTKCLVLWPGIAHDSVVTINRVRQMTSPSGLAANVDAQRSWLPIIAVGLAAKIAGKYNKEWEAGLVAEYAGKLRERPQDEDHHPVQMAFRAFGWGRERRH